MRLRIAVLSLSLGLLAPAAAYASPITSPDVTFYVVNAQMQESFPGTTAFLYGSVTINTVTGSFVSEDLFIDNIFLPEASHYPLRYIFSGPITAGNQGADLFGEGPNTYGTYISGSEGSTALDDGPGGLIFVLPGSSLVGYSGGPICSLTNYGNGACSLGLTQLNTGNDDELWSFPYSGSLTEIDPTPEPSSLVLLGTGMVGVAAAVRRRFRRN